MMLLDDLLCRAGARVCRAVVCHADFLSLRLQAETRGVPTAIVPSLNNGTLPRPGAIRIRDITVLDEALT